MRTALFTPLLQALEAIMEHNRDIICPDERNILLAHGFFMHQHHESEENTPLLPQTCGSETSVGTSDLTDLSCCEGLFDYVALGHLHSAQRAGSDIMRYSGSPLKYSVDEAKNSKSVTVVEITEKGKISFSLTPLIPRRDLRLICGTMEELCKQENKSEDYVFAQITSDGPVLNAMSRRGKYIRIHWGFPSVKVSSKIHRNFLLTLLPLNR